MAKLKPQKLPDVLAMSHEIAAITLDGSIESLKFLVQEITYRVEEEKSLIEDRNKNIVKLKVKLKQSWSCGWRLYVRNESQE